MKQLENEERFIIANITWNREGWRNIYVDRRAGHRYAKKHPGHESLNFDFDKRGLDTEKRVFGYFKWTNPPSRLGKEAVVFFYSKNLNNHRNEIVGAYGNVQILDPPHIMKWKGFEGGQLYSTLSADKSLSLLFPMPLDADKYSRGKRLVPQAGFRYIDSRLAETIVVDEMSKLKVSGLKEQEYERLTRLYKFITGKEYERSRSAGQNEEESDKEEQSELEKQISKEVLEDPRKKQELMQELKALSPKTPIQVEYKGRFYKRDNKTIAQLKVLRDFRCQLCGNRILKKNGEFYVEAAHIRPKSQKGAETPNNILILCPNHHKEFDLGSKTIIEQTDEKIVFELNQQRYEIGFSLD
jgi:putative restriction endonuclease